MSLPVVEHVLAGCTASPLAHYLKALAVLRLVGEQADSEVRGYWRAREFVIRTTLTRDDLLTFFLRRYQPSPVVSPWNGGSGFAPKDNREALGAIGATTSERFDVYRRTIRASEALFVRFAGSAKVNKDVKEEMLSACRAELPDEALPWLDAACVITSGRVAFPPLLGTGGNDGRLDFSNNFMQRLLDVLPTDSGDAPRRSRDWLDGSLFGSPVRGLLKGKAIGQFLPSAAGGPNATAGFDADSLVNPWDFVLLVEGSILFAAAAVRRLEANAHGGFAYPFTVRSTRIGYTSAAPEESRGEIWLPTWSKPASPVEVITLLSEGRAQVGRRRARSAIDFARAVAAYGVDRGLDGFERYGFHERNGLAYFATHLDHVPVRRNPKVDLLDEVDGWIEALRSKSGGDGTPASVRRAVNELDRACLALCRDGAPRRVQDVLIALGACEQTLVASVRWAQDDRGGLRPLVGLSGRWVEAADDGSAEWALAVSLASVSRPDGTGIRSHLEAVEVARGASGDTWASWAPAGARSNDVVRTGAGPIDLLVAIAERWLLRAERDGLPSGGLAGSVGASLADVAAFIDARLDEDRIVSLLGPLTFVDRRELASSARASARVSGVPDAGYALLKLCAAGRPVREVTVPLDRSIFRHAAAGDLSEATRRASRRLRASDLPVAIEVMHSSSAACRRRLAAVLFPLNASAVDSLARQVLRPDATLRSSTA